MTPTERPHQPGDDPGPTDDEAPPTPAESETAELLALANATLGGSASRRLVERLAHDAALRREHERDLELQRDVTSVGRDAPAFGRLRGPWLDVPGTVDPDVATGRRWRRPLTAAAAVLLVATAAVAAGRLGDEGPSFGTPAVLTARPSTVLALGSASTVDARTARLDIGGEGSISFDGAAMGRDGERVRVGIELTGDGALRFAATGEQDATDFRVRTSFVGVSGPEIAQPDRSVSETIRVDGRTYTSTDGIDFEESDDDDDPGALGQLVLEPDVLGRLDTLADGEVRDLGIAEIGGVQHRHVAFTASEDLFDDRTNPPAEVEVWVSADDATVTRFVLRLDGPLEDPGLPDADLQLEFRLDLVDIGAAVDIVAPG